MGIVTLNVSQTIAPAPPTLQRTGSLVSQGGTTTAQNTRSLLTQLSDLTPLLAGSQALSAIAWASGTVTATTAAPHGYPNGETLGLTVAGVLSVPGGYNGTVQATITGVNTFTYPLATNPGTATAFGAVTDADVSELLSMATTYFAQGSTTAVYVHELGAGTPTQGVETLQAWITANPGVNYAWLVPREWDGNAAFLALLPTLSSPTSKVYFHITTTLTTYGQYSQLWKDALLTIEAPGIPSTEFSAAAGFYDKLNYAPSAINRVTPAAFAFFYGVTPYPTTGNSALLATLKAANVNIVGTGAEGGISTACDFYGTTLDGRDFTYWYSVDWVQINCKLNVANAVINGSNNPQAPLYYNQPGIDVLTGVIVSTMNSAVAFGLSLSGFAVTATPFATYVVQNPDDFPKGIYSGFGVTYTPNRGFEAITVDIDVTDFANAA